MLVIIIRLNKLLAISKWLEQRFYCHFQLLLHSLPHQTFGSYFFSFQKKWGYPTSPILWFPNSKKIDVKGLDKGLIDYFGAVIRSFHPAGWLWTLTYSTSSLTKPCPYNFRQIIATLLIHLARRFFKLLFGECSLNNYKSVTFLSR